MSALRRFAMGFAIAAVLGIGLQTATLEAKKPGPQPPSQDAVCAYLWTVITYPNVSAWILEVATQLFTSYGCTAPQ